MVSQASTDEQTVPRSNWPQICQLSQHIFRKGFPVYAVIMSNSIITFYHILYFFFLKTNFFKKFFRYSVTVVDVTVS